MNKLKIKKVTVDEKNGIKFLELDNHQVLELKQSWFSTPCEEGDELVITNGLNGNIIDENSGNSKFFRNSLNNFCFYYLKNLKNRYRH